MGKFSELDAIFHYSDDPLVEATEWIQRLVKGNKGDPDQSFEIAMEEHKKWLKNNNQRVTKENYKDNEYWWTSDDFPFFATWLMEDMSSHGFKWKQIANTMKDLAVSPYKFKKDYDRYIFKQEELESLINNNPDDGSWKGR